MNNVPEFERVVKRGQMYYVHKLPPYEESREVRPKAGRPAVIVSRDEDNFMSGTVEVAYFTSLHNVKFIRETQVKCSTGTRISGSVCKCEQIDTVDKRCLGDYIGDLSDDDAYKVDNALLISLGFNIERISELFDIEPTGDTNAKDLQEKLESANEEKRALRAEVTQLQHDLRELQSRGDTSAEAERWKQMYQDLVRTLAGRS